MTKIKASILAFKNTLLTLTALKYFILGAIGVLAIAPFHQWYLIFLCFGGMYGLLDKESDPHKGFTYGFAFGAGFFLIGLYWISNAIFVHWEDYWWSYPGALLGLPLFLALFWGITSLLIVKFSPPSSYARGFLFIAGFATVEWVRGWIFTGFPWNLPGYAWSGVLEVAQLSAYGGIFWLTLITLLWATLLGKAFLHLKSNQWKAGITPIVLIAFVLITLGSAFFVGSARISDKAQPADTSSGYLIVQPNIPQKIKWKPELISQHLNTLIELSTYDEALYPSLPSETLRIVWPETAMIQSYFDHPRIKAALKEMLQSWPVETELLSGMLHLVNTPPYPEYYNSLYYIDNNAELIKRYDKSHLVPFGEYIPFLPNSFIVPLIGFSGFVPGIEGEPITYQNSQDKIFPLICYEIIFPRHLDLRDNNNDAAAIITVTNDAWYGNSPGPYQHHAMAKFRAIEQGLPVIRSANTGISGAFDSLGRQIVPNIGYNDAGVQFLYSPKSLSDGTFYTKYGNILFFSTLSIFYFLFIVLMRKLY